MSDWFRKDSSRGAVASAEAYGVNPQGVIIDLDVSVTNTAAATAGLPDYSEFQASASSTATAPYESYSVQCGGTYNQAVQSNTTGWVGHAKTKCGADNELTFEAAKTGAATGSIAFRSGASTQDANEMPTFKLECLAGSSLIVASYLRANDTWSVFGSLEEVGGRRTINTTVAGFGNLDESFSYYQVIGQGSYWTIRSEINDGSRGAQAHTYSAGSAISASQSVDCGVVLSQSIK